MKKLELNQMEVYSAGDCATAAVSASLAITSLTVAAILGGPIGIALAGASFFWTVGTNQGACSRELNGLD